MDAVFLEISSQLTSSDLREISYGIHKLLEVVSDKIALNDNVPVIDLFELTVRILETSSDAEIMKSCLSIIYQLKAKTNGKVLAYKVSLLVRFCEIWDTVICVDNNAIDDVVSYLIIMLKSMKKVSEEIVETMGLQRFRVIYAAQSNVVKSKIMRMFKYLAHAKLLTSDDGMWIVSMIKQEKHNKTRTRGLMALSLSLPNKSFAPIIVPLLNAVMTFTLVSDVVIAFEICSELVDSCAHDVYQVVHSDPIKYGRNHLSLSLKLVVLLAKLLPSAKTTFGLNPVIEEDIDKFCDECTTLFCNLIEKMSLNMIMDGTVFEAFLAFFTVKPFVISPMLAKMLLVQCKNEKSASCIAHIVAQCSTESFLVSCRAGLVDFLIETKVQNQEYGQYVDLLCQRKKEYFVDVPETLVKAESLTTALDELRNTSFCTRDLLRHGVIEHLRALFDSETDISSDNVAFLYELLHSVLFGMNLDIIGSDGEFVVGALSKKIPIQVIVDDEMEIINVGGTLYGLDIEEWLNREDAQTYQTQLIFMMHTKPEIVRIFGDLCDNTVRCNYFSPSAYNRYSLLINDQIIRKSLQVLTMLRRYAGRQESYVIAPLNTDPGVTIPPADPAPKSFGTGDTMNDVRTVMSFMDSVHTRYGNRPAACDFDEWIRSQAIDFISTHTYENFISYLAFQHPYMLSLDTRILLTRLFCSSLDSAYAMHRSIFGGVSPNQSLSNMVHMHVRRDSIWDDGVNVLNIMKSAGRSICIVFEGENARGTGPNQEFFMMMSREFQKSMRNMWSTTTYTEYVFNKEGLFPSPMASYDNMYLLGVFLALAVQMNMLVDMAFNPAFFDIVKGKTVEFKDVEPELVLDDKEGLLGLPFVYPGTELEMVENGMDVITTEENIDEFIELIKSYACGRKFNELIISPFLSGWTEVLDESILSIFSSQEICGLLHGLDKKVTFEELIKNVKVKQDKSRGFKDAARTQRDFCQIVADMTFKDQKKLFKFITGSAYLPVGGIQALTHPITLIHTSSDDKDLEDKRFPMAETCYSNLKLPDYSSIDVMRERIMSSINMGLDWFGFA